MKRLLERLSWKLRRLNFKLAIGYVTYNGAGSDFELAILRIDNSKFDSYSLLRFDFRLPNKTTTRVFVVDNWDLFFINTPLNRHYLKLVDKELWNRRYLTRWDRIKLVILSKIL